MSLVQQGRLAATWSLMVGTRPQWYPDWEGETVVVVASGPSAVDIPLDEGIGRAKFVAINRSVDLCPWADVYYCCDFQWWAKYDGCQNFRGLKVCVDYRIRDKPKWGVNFLNCAKPDDRLIMDRIGTVGWGGNSGFNCLNWVAQLKPAKIILVGFDMTKAWGSHWHKPHPLPLTNPTNFNVERWRRVMEAAAIPLREAGICVINCSVISSLRKYPKMTFAEALDYQPGTPMPAPPPAPSHHPPGVPSPVPASEAKLLDPLDGCSTMLELGNKKNQSGLYKDYFVAMGFSHTSIDLNGLDGALKLDLQKPLDLGQQFDVVTNFGTSEHVDNQTACWRNIIEHCGKFLVSTTPLPGDWKWHGRWYPRPDFYTKLAETNGFSLDRLYIDGASPRRMIFARMTRVHDREFCMPPEMMIYRNGAGRKIGAYG